MPQMVRLDTSFRTLPALETWKYLQPFRQTFDITRVTKITLLDTVGVPVVAAIRPSAQEGSLCVSSGKALSDVDARVGALCEAIELACAEFDADRDQITVAPIASLEMYRDLDIYDFCVRPQFLKRVPLNAQMDFVGVKEYFSGKDFLIPATLVFVPYHDPLGSAVLGQSSNGLSGGNSLEEALLHAVLEVVERDTLSFASVGGLERRVVKIDDPRWLELEDKIQAAGLRIYVTYCQNVFQLPMFICYLFDPAFWSGVCVARGQGIHLNKAISLLRAVTEAVQSRLTNIHGGRDDIIRRFTTYQKLGAQREVHEFTQLESDIAKFRTIQYGDIYTHFALGDNLEGALSFLLENIYKLGFEYLFYYDLTKHMTNYRVLKVVIPAMEFHSPTRPRIGKRLLSHVAGS